MLVGFPVAFYTATFLAYAAYDVSGDRFWFRFGVVTNIAGVIAAALAAIPGFIDWAVSVPRRHPARSTGLKHMLLNAAALVSFAIDAYLQRGEWTALAPSSDGAVTLALFGLAFTAGAGVLGWKMVQTHHVGVDLSVEQERLDSLPPRRPSTPLRGT